MVDERTTGRGFILSTAGTPPHDWLQNMGGSIGWHAMAVGAASPVRTARFSPSLAMAADVHGAGALDHGREGLDVTAVIWANRTYQILKGEFDNVGAGKPGQKANDMLEIGRPDLDWGIGHGHGGSRQPCY